MFSFTQNFNGDHVFYDDFVVGQNGESGYAIASSGGAIGLALDGDAQHPGIVTATMAGASNDRACLRVGINSLQFGGGDWFAQAVVQLVALSNVTDEYVFAFGYYDTTNADAIDGVYWEYDRATAGDFWRAATSNNSVRTKDTTSIAVTAGTWYRLGIEINSSGNRAKYYVNGALIDTISSNIPNGTARTTAPFWGYRKTAGTGSGTLIAMDNWLIKYTQTNPTWSN
jgi:hypothetical protein